MRYTSLLFLLFLMACSQDEAKVKDILTAEGYTNVSVGGYSAFACSEKDLYANSFVAEKNGQIIEGTVCAGSFKNNTIRIAKTHSKEVTPAVRQADSIIAARRQALIDSITNGTLKP